MILQKKFLYGKGIVLRSFPNLDSFEICIEYP